MACSCLRCCSALGYLQAHLPLPCQAANRPTHSCAFRSLDAAPTPSPTHAGVLHSPADSKPVKEQLRVSVSQLAVSQPCGCISVGLSRCRPSAHAGGKQADLQLRFVPASSLNNDGVSAYRDFADLKSSGVKWPTGFTFQIIAVRPESKGKIGLKSDDPWDSPAILPQYLTDKEGRDAATLRWATAGGR